ncbi:hypothetical protein F5Y15DRAFT_272000 [Xylariaceae sp. FL0016]|nr:hypothetical protein F5Y15DRAFT_272000 [Xylariaceae sp. FL0016]
MIPLAKVGFVLHAIIETAAAVSFIFNPEKQLPGCTPAARLILRQYGGLLLASSLVCVAVLLDETGSDSTTRLLAFALGTYHLLPCYRAYTRLERDVQPNGRKAPEKSHLGGPWVHLAVHLLCLFLFALPVVAFRNA